MSWQYDFKLARFCVRIALNLLQSAQMQVQQPSKEKPKCTLTVAICLAAQVFLRDVCGLELEDVAGKTSGWNPQPVRSSEMGDPTLLAWTCSTLERKISTFQHALRFPLKLKVAAAQQLAMTIS